ncbi:MAG: carboxypeptidase regulatory-like domain-containing protein [Pyrinomonadaceae bacterium]|nr:carboxypeptidase regulatory-like domain-containing protein [Pyrinomonadaceae bacterium]
MIARTAVPLVSVLAYCLLCAFPLQARAQAPTGTIVGVVTDPTGVPVASVLVTITNRDSRLTRRLNTSDEGDYSAAALPPGVYRVTAEATGFPLLESTVTVQVGTTTTVNLILQIGKVRETVTVDDAAPLLHYDQHQVSGVVSRAQIENLPLNGRDFLELAKLEPGVTNPVRGTNNRVSVPTLGSGTQTNPRIGYTRVTVDGADINFVDSIGAALQVSQEAVQEFQISTVNFDLSTGVTSNAAINIVTRSGGNDFHGSLFYFCRDHNLAAYPGLQRDQNNPHPFFQRQQFGYRLGGPIRKDRAFFFTSYERNDQRGVLSIQPRTPEFAPLGGIFSSPFLGNQFNLRFDAAFSQKHNAFVRYTHDGNSVFGLSDGRNNSLPSGWSRLKNWVDQSMAGLTSVVAPSMVNDLRFSYFFISSPETPASAADCPTCLGVGAPRINIADVGLMFGNARRLSFVARRYQLTESLAWQKDQHRFRFGFDWEHATTSAQRVEQEPAMIELYSPRQVRNFNTIVPPAARIALPSSFLRLEDILQLPLRSFQTSVGPSVVLQRDFRKHRVTDLFRLYAADTWRIGPRLTVNYGLAWSYEPHTLNTGLTKPELLTAILGPDNLNPPRAQTGNLAPAVGFAWAATRDGKTVIRGGAGRYFDPVSANSINVTNERVTLFPAGTGRRTVPGSAIFYQGRALDFPQRPTTLTAADLLTLLPGIQADLTAQLNPDNRDFTFRNLDLNKTGSNLSDPFYETPFALHFNLGVQRELARDLVLSADFAGRRFLHTYLPGIDYNRFNRRPQGPVIPRCTEAQKNDLTAVCSNGPITFDSTSGIAQYKGLLVRLEKRFSRRTQFLASYALGSFKGTNGLGGAAFPGTGFNNDNWSDNYGPLPTDLRHTLNLSGFVDLPWQFQVSFSVSAYSRPPFSAYVSGIDFNGDGTQNDLLPGTKVNQFNRGLGKDDLRRLVENYNQEFAGKLTTSGEIAPRVTLPANYSFTDSFFTQDLRLSHTFSLGSERVRFVLFGEVFNLLNTANLIQYSGNIADTASFGQPGARFSQVFGSGGPRAFQFGARISF